MATATASKLDASLEEKRRLAMSRLSAFIKPVSKSAAASGSSTPNPSALPPQPSPAPVLHKNENPKITPSSYGLRPLYREVNIENDKWLLTIDEEAREKLENPPSRADGVTAEMEEDIRYLGSELIQSGAILLKLPQTAAATGQILFQRFYYMRSMTKVHFEHMVMACLLLAAKIEEAPRRPRDVLNVFHRLEQLHRLRQKGLRITPEQSAKLKPKILDANYVGLKNAVIKTERRLLATLGFVVHVKHPHKLLFSYAFILGCDKNEDLMQKAWSYMNDGLRTDMFVRYSTETIACACMYLAARTITPKLKLPDQPFPWFELFDASDRDVRHISEMLLKLYQRKRAPNWTLFNNKLDELKFGAEKKPEKDETKKLEKLSVKETRNSPDENRRDGKGRTSSSRSRSRTRSRSRGDYRDRSRNKRDNIRRRNYSPEDRRVDRRDDRDRFRGKNKGGRDEKRRRSRDRRDERDRMKNRERDVRAALKNRSGGGSGRKDSPSPPSRYRK